jgi:hypothetical protein
MKSLGVEKVKKSLIRVQMKTENLDSVLASRSQHIFPERRQSHKITQTLRMSLFQNLYMEKHLLMSISVVKVMRDFEREQPREF